MCLYLYKETSEVYTEMNCVYISFVGEIVTHTHTQLVFRFPNRPNVIGSSFDLNASQDTSLKKIKYIYEKSRRYKCKTTRNEIGSFFMFSTEIDKLLLKKWSINTNYITKKIYNFIVAYFRFFFCEKVTAYISHIFYFVQLVSRALLPIVCCWRSHLISVKTECKKKEDRHLSFVCLFSFDMSKRKYISFIASKIRFILSCCTYETKFQFVYTHQFSIYVYVTRI